MVVKENQNGEMTGMHIYVLIASCLMAWAVMGMLNAYGVFFTPMGKALGVGRAAVTLHLSLRTLVTGLTAPLVALLLKKRVRPRITMPLGMIVFLVSCLLIPKAKSVIVVDILAAISGVGLAFFSFMLITIILGNWFYKNLGTFSGIAIAFSGIGSAIASPIITKMLEIHGYQKVYTMYIIIIILMVVPILLVPFWPQDMGLNPYGEGMVVENKKVKVEKNLDLPYKLISAMAIVLFAMTVFIMAGTALNSHLPSLALDNGFSADTGALLLSVSMIGNLVSKLVLGVVIDRRGVIQGFILILTTSILGFILILISSGSTLPLLVGGFLYGTIFSLGSLGLSILTRYLYGNEQYNQVYSTIIMMTSVGSAIFVTIIGALYDLTGSYQVPLLLGIAMEALTLLLIFWLIGRIRKQKKGTN